MSNRIRIYRFPGRQISLAITCQGNPDAETWPDDAVIEDMWIERTLNPTTLCFKVSHPSFAEIAEYCVAPGFYCGLVERRPVEV